MPSAGELLATAMDEAYGEFVARLDGLSDDEFFWEPVPGCWNVYRDADGTWTYPYEEPDPVPSPVTTIGWRLVHVALCKVIYHEWAFGPRRLTFMNIENPGNVETSMTMLREGHELLSSDLAALKDDLDRRVLANWGEEWPAWRIFQTMTDHDARHGPEIGVLRDLYRSSGGAMLDRQGIARSREPSRYRRRRRPREYRELEAGTAWPSSDTYDRMCELYGWSQTFVGPS